MEEKQDNRQKSKQENFPGAFEFGRLNPKAQAKKEHRKASIKVQISVVEVPVEKKQKTKETQKNLFSVDRPQKEENA